MKFIDTLKKKVRKNSIVAFPEYSDKRILAAACELKKQNLIKPVLVGNPLEIHNYFRKFKLSSKGICIIDSTDKIKLAEYAAQLVVLRKEKNLTLADAHNILSDEIYFAAMLLKEGSIDGIVSGAMHPTSHTLKPAFQIIKTSGKYRLASSFFIMINPKKPKEVLFFADCGVNPDPDPGQLADIAIATADSARLFGIKPRVAMLSFSSAGSAAHPLVDKVQQATSLVKSSADFPVDGEIQFDAAISPEVSRRKFKNSVLHGKANVFIFPDLNSGNIGYKIAQHFGKLEAIGPIVQGLAKPVNDLSRGCTVKEIIDAAIITAIQAKK